MKKSIGLTSLLLTLIHFIPASIHTFMRGKKNALSYPKQIREENVPLTSLETSFLKVYAGCKVDHASFEAKKIAPERVSEFVNTIHAQMEKA